MIGEMTGEMTGGMTGEMTDEMTVFAKRMTGEMNLLLNK